MELFSIRIQRTFQLVSTIQRESFFVDCSRTSIPAAFDGMFDYLYCLCILCIIRWDNLLFHIYTFCAAKVRKNTGDTGRNVNILWCRVGIIPYFSYSGVRIRLVFAKWQGRQHLPKELQGGYWK